MKKHILLLFAVLLLSLSGCGIKSGIGGSRGDSADHYYDYRHGTEGIVLAFSENIPPSRIYDDEQFVAVIETANRGATDVDPAGGRIYLSGFDIAILRGVTGSDYPSQWGYFAAEIGNLLGKSFTNPEGDFDTVQFEGDISDLKARDIETYTPTLLATVCYLYETLANPVVCIDGDPHSAAITRKVCRPQDVVLSGGQGGPIEVSKVDVEAAPRQTLFKIHVRNGGGGTVFKDEFSYLDRCNPYDPEGLGYSDVDRVRLSEVSVGNTDITPTCKGLDDNGHIRLKSSGTGTVFCKLSDVTGPAYTSPLRIKVKYGYRSTITKSLTILQTPS